MKIAKYIVKFYDEGNWFVGTVFPVNYKEARKIQAFYAELFPTKIVYADERR